MRFPVYNIGGFASFLVSRLNKSLRKAIDESEESEDLQFNLSYFKRKPPQVEILTKQAKGILPVNFLCTSGLDIYFRDNENTA